MVFDSMRHADRWVVIEQPTAAGFVVHFYRAVTTDKTVYQREGRSFRSFGLMCEGVERFLVSGTDPAGADVDVANHQTEK